jgi:hypothetical protein
MDVCKPWSGRFSSVSKHQQPLANPPKYSGQLKTTAASEYPACSSSGHMHARKANSSATGACKQVSTQTGRRHGKHPTHHDQVSPSRSVPRFFSAEALGAIEAGQQERRCKKQAAQRERCDTGLQQALRVQS